MMLLSRSSYLPPSLFSNVHSLISVLLSSGVNIKSLSINYYHPPSILNLLHFLSATLAFSSFLLNLTFHYSCLLFISSHPLILLSSYPLIWSIAPCRLYGCGVAWWKTECCPHKQPLQSYSRSATPLISFPLSLSPSLSFSIYLPFFCSFLLFESPSPLLQPASPTTLHSHHSLLCLPHSTLPTTSLCLSYLSYSSHSSLNVCPLINPS